MKYLALVAVALGAAAAPASAVTFTDYDIDFVGGAAIVAPTIKYLPGEYQDNFHFTTTQAATFSGSLSTQRLFDLSGLIVSDLDFGNTLPVDGVHLDSTYFVLATGGSDALEVQNLPTTLIGPGDHVLTVNYTIQFADLVNGAVYAGPVFLSAAAVPEPATWAMMIVGFGAIGMSARRRAAARTTQVSFV